MNEYVRFSLQKEAQALLKMSQSVDEEYNKAIELLNHCKGKVVVTGIGKSGHIGKKIAASLSSTGTPSFFVHSAEAIHGDSGMIEPKDVVVLLSNSGETTEVLNIQSIVSKIGSPQIAITKNKNSTLAKNSHVSLTYDYETEADHLGVAPTTSALLQLAIGDSLAVALSQIKGFTKEQFHLYHPGGSLGTQLAQEISVTKSDD